MVGSRRGAWESQHRPNAEHILDIVKKMDPMGTHQATPATPAGLPFFTWQPPDGSVKIHLLFDVIDRILPDVMRGFGALPRRGAEVGGILFGKFDLDASIGVLIEDFEPIPCEYSTGPSYHLSQRDLERLEEALREAHSRNQTVVGLYRSHTRKELFLDADDLDLAKQYFANPAQVILLIKPFATRTSVAGFFFWEDGEIHSESSYREFPFHRRELGGGEPNLSAGPGLELPGVQYRTAEDIDPALRRHSLPSPPPLFEPPAPLARAGGAAAESFLEPRRAWAVDAADTSERRVPSVHRPAQPAAIPTFGLPPRPPKDQQGARRKWLLTPVLLGVLSVSGYVLYQQLAPPAPAPTPPVTNATLLLKLEVVENGDRLEVNWERQSAVIAGAVRGTLTVLDGPNRRNIELTASQLRNNRVLYSRLTGDVLFRLEVFTSERSSLTESVRFVAPAAGSGGDVITPETVQANADAVPDTVPASGDIPPPPPPIPQQTEPPEVSPQAAPTEPPPQRSSARAALDRRRETKEPKTTAVSKKEPERAATVAPAKPEPVKAKPPENVLELEAPKPPPREIPKPTRRR